MGCVYCRATSDRSTDGRWHSKSQMRLEPCMNEMDRPMKTCSEYILLIDIFGNVCFLDILGNSHSSEILYTVCSWKETGQDIMHEGCLTQRSACNFADIFTVCSALEILSPVLRKELRQVFVASQSSSMKRTIFCPQDFQKAQFWEKKKDAHSSTT